MAVPYQRFIKGCCGAKETAFRVKACDNHKHQGWPDFVISSQISKPIHCCRNRYGEINGSINAELMLLDRRNYKQRPRKQGEVVTQLS